MRAALRAIVRTAILLPLVAGACSERSTAGRATPETANLGGTTVATVGSDAIDGEVVGAVAAARRVSLVKARDFAIRDALLAQGARATRPTLALVAERAVLARAVLEAVDREAKALGPPTDEEIATLTREQWLDLDRPPAARTVHFVALPASPLHERAARALAERFRSAAKGLTEADAFKSLATTFPGTAEVGTRAEDLPPITADGRLADLENRPEPGAPTPRFDERFAKAANAIGDVGEQSPVIESDYGWHVILLVERLPPVFVPLEERRRTLEPQVHAARASSAVERILSARRAEHPVEVVRHADDLTARLGHVP